MKWIALLSFGLVGAGVLFSGAVWSLPAEPKTLTEYFRSFCASQHHDDLLRAPRLVLDDKNGYAAVVLDVDPGSENATFVVWEGQDKSRLFGFSEGSEGPEGSSYRASFWRYRAGQWAEAQGVTPALDLKDFWGDAAPLPEEKYRHLELEFALPRRGTTIRVIPHAIAQLEMHKVLGDDEKGFDYQKYERLLAAARYVAINLTWNRETNAFSKGAPVLARTSPARPALPTLPAAPAGMRTAEECKSSGEKADAAAERLAPAEEFVVTGKGRLFLHGAPDPGCRSKDQSVMPEEKLFGYARANGWLSVMFIDKATGDTVSGWVREDRLKGVGSLGPATPPDPPGR